MDNLPKWAGAGHCYTKAYRFLDQMRANGHVVRRGSQKVGRRVVCTVSDDMRDLIDALNHGDEERIKYLLMVYPSRFSYLK